MVAELTTKCVGLRLSLWKPLEAITVDQWDFMFYFFYVVQIHIFYIVMVPLFSLKFDENKLSLYFVISNQSLDIVRVLSSNLKSKAGDLC